MTGPNVHAINLVIDSTDRVEDVVPSGRDDQFGQWSIKWTELSDFSVPSERENGVVQRSIFVIFAFSENNASVILELGEICLHACAHR